MQTTKRLWIGCLYCALVVFSAGARSEWGLDTAAGFTYDDNLSNSLEADDRKADTAAVIDLSGGLREQLGASTGLSLSLLANSQTYLRYSGLSNIGLGARVLLRTKFGLGAEAPWLAVAAQGVYHNYHYDYLDGWQYEAGATLGKQFGERWGLRASIRYDAYVAQQVQPPIILDKSGSPYDTYGWNLGVQATFLATDADLLALSFNWRTGTVTSVSGPDEEILEYSDRVAPTPVFGNPEFAYRINADTQTISLAWSHALDQRAAMNLVYAYRRSQAEYDLGDYSSNVITLSFSYTFY
ncbi:MAG TPA: hypothetical protein VMH26_06100 [Burkholderiales bacterium]|nr:hypothetical protein [Burkholderiales bacterium]